MASNRIQKLLFSEYSDFEDVVLMESPFAETDRKGKGIRQVQMGITPTKLILATFYIEPLDGAILQETEQSTLDPDIDSFELVAAYPVECVNLSVYRHRRRQTLKARFCNDKVSYYEIGGWQERTMMWRLWCERIKFLSPYETSTCVSETSVASSSSDSSLYIVHSALSLSPNGRPTLWCHYALSKTNSQGAWVDPHLYLGSMYMEKGINYMTLPSLSQGRSDPKPKNGKSEKDHRYEPPVLSSEHEEMARQAVELWESQRGLMRKIHRRYGFCPFPGLLAGLGIWRLPKPQAFSLQVKRSASEVRLSDTSAEPSSRHDLSHKQLVRTVSLEDLDVPAICPDMLFQLAERRPQKSIKFWTRDQGLDTAWQHKQYKAQQRYLRLLRRHCKSSLFGLNATRRNRRKHYFQTNQNFKGRQSRLETCIEVQTESGVESCVSQTSLNSAFTVLGDKSIYQDQDITKKYRSSSLAHQLTMVDKHLFLQISTLELGRMYRDMSSWRTTIVSALLLFAHRVTCLVATHVIAGSSVKKRAGMIVKFVGVAYRCHRLHNIQSTVSVLQGLQCPAVYRLHDTWKYVRRHHASKYRRFEDLSRRYLDPRLPLYQKTYDNLNKTPPFLPCVELLVALLLRKLSDLPDVKSTEFSTECSSSCKSPAEMPKNPLGTFRRFMSALNLHRPNIKPSTSLSVCQSDTHLRSVPEKALKDNLDKFFAPVSQSCPMRHLQDVEFFLNKNQIAASRYAIPINPKVRAFLLNAKYDDMPLLFKVSAQMEEL